MEDIFRKGKDIKRLFSALEDGTAFKYEKNTELVKIYIDAKFNGSYFDILYDCSKPELTCYKNLIVLRKLEEIVDKPFCDLTKQDIRLLQQKLNSNELTVKFNPMVKGKVRQMSRSYKQDIIVNIKQFWKFYMMYCLEEENRSILDIVQFLRLRREERNNNLIKFVTRDEIDLIVRHTRVPQMKAFLITFFETGARISEILELRFSNCQYDENRKRWIVRLPNTKGCSTTKMPVELEISADLFADWIYFSKPKPEDRVFNYSYHYIKKFLYEKGKELCGRAIVPKEVRKGCTMWLLSLNANEQYIRGHMGWAASSKAIAHYINQKSLKKPDSLKAEIQQGENAEMIRENETLKLKQKQQEIALKEFQDQMEAMKQEQLKLFDQMKEVDVSASKNILKAVFEDIVNKSS